MKKNLKILFLCTGNSCRSQMAEGWTKKLTEHIPFSAGTEKHGLNPHAVEVMSEVGVDISSHYSKLIDELPQVDFDYVVTVCDSAKEKCPYWPGDNISIHKSFGDPPKMSAKAKSKEETLMAYRQIRDEIKQFIINFDQKIRENKTG